VGAGFGASFLAGAFIEFIAAAVGGGVAFEAAFTFIFGAGWVNAEFTSSVLAFASPAGLAVFAFAFASAGCSAAVVERTETSPVSAGIDISSAETIKPTAAAMVIFDSTVCVPRGLKAVLEILLVKSAPASVLPGCSSTEATSTMQDKKNIAYKM
jgi:hypothetical protein